LSRDLKDLYSTVRFPIDQHADPNDFSHVDLLLVILERLTDMANTARLKIQPPLIKAIAGWLSETLKNSGWSLEGADVSLSLLAGQLGELKGTIKFSKDTKKRIAGQMEPRLSQLLEQCNLLAAAINAQLRGQGKRLLLVVENLDKLPPPIARDLFLEHGPTLVGINMHAIYTVPISMTYSPDGRGMRDRFDWCEILPMIKVHDRQRRPCDPGIVAIETILHARMEKSLIHEDARRELIASTGGCLRDVFDVLQAAALEARRTGKDVVDLTSMRFGLIQRRNTLERYITERSEGGAVQVSIKQYYDKLVAVAADPLRKPANDRVLLDLLDSRTVLEYNGGDRWCDVHPLVLSLLREKGLVHRGDSEPNRST
jgi:hypothetical protein